MKLEFIKLNLLNKANITKIRIAIVTAFLLFFVLAPQLNPSFAQIGIGCPEGEVYLSIFDACLNFGEAMGLTISWALILGALIALVKFAIGAVQIITSTGQPTKLANARATVTDAVLGFILITTAWLLLNFFSDSLPEEWDVNFFILFGG